jgi:hypothetical protein
VISNIEGSSDRLNVNLSGFHPEGPRWGVGYFEVGFTSKQSDAARCGLENNFDGGVGVERELCAIGERHAFELSDGGGRLFREIERIRLWAPKYGCRQEYQRCDSRRNTQEAPLPQRLMGPRPMRNTQSIELRGRCLALVEQTPV